MLKMPSISNKKGMAMIELLPLMLTFTLIMNFAFGFFGVIHSAILNSIACRNYAFETFNSRTNLIYFRDSPTGVNPAYAKMGSRFHAVLGDDTPPTSGSSSNYYATRRPIDFIGETEDTGTLANLHNDSNSELNRILTLPEGQRYEGEGVNPIWIKTQCGICLNSGCGG